MVRVASWLARAGKFCHTSTVIEEVGLFCVVKNIEWSPKRDPLVSLQLVFDYRRGNPRRKEPPWCASGGTPATDFRDRSRELRLIPGMKLVDGTGGAPDFYYRANLGTDEAKFFTLPRLAAQDLASILGDERNALEMSGIRIGVRVALIGFS